MHFCLQLQVTYYHFFYFVLLQKKQEQTNIRRIQGKNQRQKQSRELEIWIFLFASANSLKISLFSTIISAVSLIFFSCVSENCSMILYPKLKQIEKLIKMQKLRLVLSDFNLNFVLGILLHETIGSCCII